MGIFGVDIPSHGSATTAGALGTRPRMFTTILVLKMPNLLLCHLFCHCHQIHDELPNHCRRGLILVV